MNRKNPQKPKSPPPPKNDKEEKPQFTKEDFEAALKKASRQIEKSGRASS